MHFTVREEIPSDIESIEAVTIAAFINVDHTDNNEQFIVRALRQSGALTLSLVAEENGQVIGHVAISPVSISDGSKGWFGIGPISVLPDKQLSGVGSKLMESVIAQLQHSGACGCVLLGEPNYYNRFGFKAEPRLTLDGVPAEYFQALSLNDSYPAGEVAYHDAFNAKS